MKQIISFLILLLPYSNYAQTDDAGVLSIDSVRGRCPGNVDVYTTIQNFGINNLNSFQIDWEIDGILQTPYIFAGILTPAATTQILLGSTIFSTGISQSFKVWTSNPNGVADTSNLNDTLSVLNVLPGLSGIYTIGTVGADYTSITSAVSSLENNGVCGATEFSINAGTYSEKVIIHEIPNASSFNNILFHSTANDSTSVILEWASSASSDSNYTLLLNGASYITFKSMTFSRTGSNVFCSAVEMDSGSSYVNFLNNIFIGPTTIVTANTNGTQSGIFNIGNAEWNDVVIRNNFFNGNANGLWLNGAASKYSDNVVIEDNVFETFYVGAFILYQNSPVINRNICTRNNLTSTVDYFGISLRFGLGAPQILKNKITGYTGSYGIRLREYTDTTSTRGLVANNFIQVGPTGTGRGIAIEAGSSGIDIFHNSVNYSGTDATLGRAFFVDGTLTSDLKVLNNIFSNTGGGYSSYVTTIALSSVDVSDNNCLFSSGPNLAFFGSIQTTLANLQAASLMESFSVNANPNFVSFNDLHTVAGALGDAGSALSGITEDIDGDVREIIHPDIGADEFTIVGLSTISENNPFKFYPNPANETLTIDATESDYFISKVAVIDVSGREVIVQNFQSRKNVIDVSKLSKGIYLLKVKYSGKVLIERIVIN